MRAAQQRSYLIWSRLTWGLASLVAEAAMVFSVGIVVQPKKQQKQPFLPVDPRATRRRSYRSILQRRTLLHDQLPHPLDKRLHRNRSFCFLLSANPHIDLARLNLLVADHKLKRHLLQRVLANLGVHFFVAHVNLDAHSGSLQLVADFVGVSLVLLADR